MRRYQRGDFGSWSTSPRMGWGSEMKPVLVFLLVVLMLVFVSGMVFAGSELANPWQAREQAALLKAQREALEAENQAKLKAMEQEQAIKQGALKDALKAQRAQEAEQRERWFQLKARLFELAVVAGLGVIAALSGAGAAYLVCAGLALLRQPQQMISGVRQEEGRVIPFPGLLQQARGLASNPAVARASLVLAIGALTVSAALGLSLIVKPAL